MCGEATATASTRPPRVSSTTSPLTIACDEARNASRSVINGSWKKPSYTSSTHLRATSRLKRFCCLLSTASSSARCAASSAVRPGASYTIRPLRPIVVSPVYNPRPTPYCANSVLSLASSSCPGISLPSIATASPCTKRSVVCRGSPGHASRGAHQPREPSPGASQRSTSPPDLVSPSSFSLFG